MTLPLFETHYSIDTLKIVCQRLATDGTKIVALHGWQDNSNSFQPLMSYLPQYDWYAIDLPGHGQSDWRHTQAHYYFIDYVNDVYALLEQIAPGEKVVLVGHSMGAMVANLFAACFPERLHCVIAIDGLACITTPENEVVMQLRKAIQNRSSNKKNRVFESLQSLAKARQSVSDLSYDNALLIMQRNCRQIDSEYHLTTDPKLKHHSGFRFSPAQCKEVCKNTLVPIMLIRAKVDYNWLSESLAMYGEYYPDLTINEVKGGHHCHLESVAEIANLIDVYVNSNV